jgi:glycosyltransferase involved in cell wall biosynthesis
MGPNNKKVIVVLPAYNAAATLARTVAEIPKLVDEIILVDDYSSDETAALAKELGLFVHIHGKNMGYGGNQKTCYSLALAHGADIIIMLHPDYQYDPKLIVYFVDLIAHNHCDMVMGNRIRSRHETLSGGMPRYKYFFNRFLTLIENLASGYNLSEWHSGMRAYSRSVLENIDFSKNSDDFVFDSQVLFQIVARHYRINEIEVPVRYEKESSSINFKRSLRYGFCTLTLAIRYFIKRCLGLKQK